MKIRISTLLLTISAFFYFGELNATEPEKGSSTTRVSQKRPRSRVIQPTEPDPKDGPANRTVCYGEIKIQAWLDSSSRVQRAVYKDNFIPHSGYYAYYNFLIRTMELDGVKLVAYINQQGGLIGVRGPRRAGQGYRLEPTESEWYVNYCAKHFKLAVRNLVPIGISLMPGNVQDLGQHLFEPVVVAGIRFKVFRGPNATITGAELISS